MSLTVNHRKVTSGKSNPKAEVDLADWNDTHAVSGNLDISQLNNGTNASATTYWRGDGTWAPPVVGWISVLTDNFGADPTGVFDSAPAFRSAVAALPSGSTLYVPPGNYLMNSVVNGSVIELPSGKSISIRGAGWHVTYNGTAWSSVGTVFKLGGGVTSTSDFIRVSSPTGTTGSVGGMEFRDFCVTTTSGIYGGALGRHAIYFDGTTSDGFFCENVLIDNLFIDNMSTGYSICAIANVTSTNGIIALSNITRNFLMSVRLVNAADGMTIRENVFGQNAINDSRNQGIYLSAVSGATTQRISDNYFLNFNGQVVIDACPDVIIENNIFEQSAASSYGTIVDINGGTAAVTGANIRGNRFSNLTAGAIIPLRINNAVNTNVYGNWFYNGLIAPFIAVTNNASGTYIDGGNYYQDTGGYKVNGNIADFGAFTRYQTPLYLQQAATNVPGVPRSGFIYSWFDATDGRLHDINSSSVIGTTVVASTAAAHKFATAVAANGVVTYTQPAITDISGIGQLTNSIGANVALNNTANFFDGPSVAQGTSGTWYASGTVTLLGAANDIVWVKLWDGTTVIASAETTIPGNTVTTVTLSGFLASPAANIKMSCRNLSSTGGSILANLSTSGKDSTLTAFRIG